VRRLLPRPHVDERRKFYATVVVLALLIAYAVAFVLENSATVTVHFVFGTARVSLIWLILLSLAVGLIGGILLVYLERRRRRRRAQKRTEPSDTV
jgi:uncharacterized integral membrane protein